MRPRTTVALVRLVFLVLVATDLGSGFAAAQSKPPSRVKPIEAAEPAELMPVPERRDVARRITKPSRDASADPAGETTPKPRTVGSPWSVGGPLILILIAVVAGAFLWRRHGPGVTPSLPRDAVDPLGRRMIDARQSLLLVRVGSRILVLASSPAGLETLTEITDPVEVDLLAGLCKRPASTQDGGMGDAVRSLFLGRGRAADVAAGAVDADHEAETHSVPPGAAVDQRFARSLSARVRSEGPRAA